jgi:hypothetical protein
MSAGYAALLVADRRTGELTMSATLLLLAGVFLR